MLTNWEQAQDRGKIGGEFFFQLLELGYEKFPHNTTECAPAYSMFIIKKSDSNIKHIYFYFQKSRREESPQQ